MRTVQICALASILLTNAGIAQTLSEKNASDVALLTVPLYDPFADAATRGDLPADCGFSSPDGLHRGDICCICVGPAHPLTGRRNTAARLTLVKAHGGTETSESAVKKSLDWLVSRQTKDGGWSFNHNQNVIPKTSECPNPGTLEARNGATGLALLPFLGAGQTHKEGNYKVHVRHGLAYLIKHMEVKDNTGNLEDKAGLLSHAWATLALCEAYGMTHDKELLAPAQLSINYLVLQQDKETGGWNSSGKQQDLLLAAWCLLAFKSGHLAYLQVPKDSIRGAMKFLDSRAAEPGKYRRYQNGKPDQLASAAAMLCGMHLGWKQDHPPLTKGVAEIARTGAGSDDVRWNFFGTNVMIQFEDENWRMWNTKLRDQLLDAQADKGVTNGSWFFAGGDGAHTGGRLYHTALTTMTLEVYYRHLPVYRQADDEAFAF